MKPEDQRQKKAFKRSQKRKKDSQMKEVKVKINPRLKNVKKT